MRPLASSLALLPFALAAACRSEAPDPIQPGVARNNGQTTSIGRPAYVCSENDCAAAAARWLESVEPTNAIPPSFVSSSCEREGEDFVCPTYVCECRTNEGEATRLAAPNPAKCALRGRAGFCLMSEEEAPSCDPFAAGSCEATCGDVQRRLADDARQKLDAEVRSAECASFDPETRTPQFGSADGECNVVVRIGEQCHAPIVDGNSNPSSAAYDCNQADHEIVLAALGDWYPAPPPPFDSPDDPSVVFDSTPAPEACPGGPTPGTFATDAERGLRSIALSPTHLYWSTNAGIHRRLRSGGADEKVIDLDGATPLSIDGSMLYWVTAPTIWSMPLDGSSGPARLVEDVIGPSSWAVSGSRLVYLAEIGNDPVRPDPRGPDYQVRAINLPGGEPHLLARYQSSTTPLAVDETGVYWFEGSACSLPARATDARPAASISKYTFATESISTLTTLAPLPDFLRAKGGRVVWADAAGIWSVATDGSERVALAGPLPLVRNLVTDGIRAYWASSVVADPFSTVYSAPLTGGEPRPIACDAYGVDSHDVVVDGDAIYYLSWIGDFVGELPTSSPAPADAGAP
jgi:hypothetical protein